MMIRPATADDIPAITQLWQELVTFHQQLDERMPTPADDGKAQYGQRIRIGLQDTSVQTYVAEVNGELVGYVLGTIIDLLPDMFQEERAGMLADIYVQADYRSQGIGYALVDQLRQWFKLRGVEHFEWYVATQNAAGIRFWREAIGGEPVMQRMRASVEAPTAESTDESHSTN